MQLEFTPEAEQDLAAAFQWYEGQFAGLGTEFVRAADLAFARVLDNPRLYPRVYRTFRRILLPRFPYAAFYLFQQQQVVVLSVLHTAQNPDLWRKRLGKA